MARQYTGTAGRTENAQVAVYLTYAGPGGHALIDRELYLPACWIKDPGRCAAAGIPPGRTFATTPELARMMIARALDAAIPAGWVAGDEVHDADPGLRAELETREAGYVLAIARHRHVTTAAGALRADVLAARLPPRAWQKLAAGTGVKGRRWHDWAWVGIDPGRPGHRWLLVRRSRRTGELACYRCYGPAPVTLTALVRVAGLRWTAEEDFPSGEGPGRPGPAPGPAVDLLVPVGHPGHARLRRAGRRRGCRARPRPGAGRADTADPQRDRPPARHPGPAAPRRHQTPDALVSVAQEAPAHRPNLPLPAASRP